MMVLNANHAKESLVWRYGCRPMKRGRDRVQRGAFLQPLRIGFFAMTDWAPIYA